MVKRLAIECRSSPPPHIVRLDGYGKFNTNCFLVDIALR